MDRWASNAQLPERLPFSKKRLPKRVIISYVLDYVIILVLIGGFYALDAVEPFHQPFSLQNYTLHYPYAVHERIPVVPNLVLITCFFPAAVIALYTLVIDGVFSHQQPLPANGGKRRLTGRYRLKDRLWELNCGILGLGLAVAGSFVIVGTLKNAIGKPRPDLIDRCQVPDNITADPDRFKLSTHAICTQKDNAILKDGFRSFPSGHSSTAFAGLFYLSLYLAAKMHVLDAKGEVWKSFIVLVPTLAAALVAGSRIMDARHHPFDVLSGSLLGILCAWGSYRQYFPPVTETWRKGRAYPIRSWGTEPAPPPPQQVRVDNDFEPLRAMDRPMDEERAASSGFSQMPPAGAPGNDEHGGNVFRQQISASQKNRQNTGFRGGPSSAYSVQHSDTIASEDFSIQRGDTTLSGKVSKYQGQLPSTNPFAADARRHDPYEYSSSEDDEGYELQQTFTTGAPRVGAYNPIAAADTDTGYHPPALPLSHTPPAPETTRAPPHQTPMSPSGDLGDARTQVPPAVPAHAAGTLS